MTTPQTIRVDCGALDQAAATIDDVTWQAELDFRSLATIVGQIADGAPGTMTADAATHFGERWNRRLSQLIDDTEEMARKLRQAAANYRATDLGAAAQVGAAAASGPPGAAIGSGAGEG